MTRKHFEAIASAVSIHTTYLKTLPVAAAGFDDGFYTGYRYGVEALSEDLADYLETQNPNFDRTRFLEACGVS